MTNDIYINREIATLEYDVLTFETAECSIDLLRRDGVYLYGAYSISIALSMTPYDAMSICKDIQRIPIVSPCGNTLYMIYITGDDVCRMIEASPSIHRYHIMRLLQRHAGLQICDDNEYL